MTEAPTPKRCWAIERGEYSDYYVVGVFTSRENAEKVLKFLTRGDNGIYDVPTIAEWPLDPAVPELNAGLNAFNVTFSEARGVSCNETTASTMLTDADDMESHWRDAQRYYSHSYRVWARDSEQAIKIASEKHTRWQTSPLRSEAP